jgi:Fe-S-cluster containining protein
MIAMETDLNKIKKLSKKKEDENWEFRSFLKRCDIPSEEIDSIVHRLYKRISSEIDCKTCANCCKEVQPVLDFGDIEKFSKGLGISISQFENQYLIKDSESENYTFNKKPCPFLKDNLCSYYAYRPKDCRSYPHLHKPYFIFRLINVIGNYSICPIVFNVYEHLKNEIQHYDNLDEFDDFY